ncbi:TPA: hypothetical protein HA361_06030 [Candidatus Woesearchaeota archaeon]|nr:hypothetical protein [Candidatus Woesearchaeota archaeon]
MADLPHNLCFHAIDGSVISSLHHLAESLEWMSDDTYYYHVNEHKNDFANWVEHVHSNAALASDIRRRDSRLGAAVAVYRHLLGCK